MNPSMQFLRMALIFLAAAPLLAFSAGDEVHLDTAPINAQDKISLQRGLHTFDNYCMGCHSAAYMRYSRLTDLGLTEQQIKSYVLPAGAKIGDTMGVAMRKEDGQQWFGAPPPDLSVIVRSRGADWLYTYLRTFYRDDSRRTGWNNLVFDKVGMPHVLWQLQGTQALKVSEKAGAHGYQGEDRTLVMATPGQLTPKEYDMFVADLVNYLVYIGEPAKTSRTQLGIIVLFFLSLIFVLTLLLKKEYWKDVK